MIADGTSNNLGAVAKDSWFNTSFVSTTYQLTALNIFRNWGNKYKFITADFQIYWKLRVNGDFNELWIFFLRFWIILKRIYRHFWIVL